MLYYSERLRTIGSEVMEKSYCPLSRIQDKQYLRSFSHTAATPITTTYSCRDPSILADIFKTSIVVDRIDCNKIGPFRLLVPQVLD